MPEYTQVNRPLAVKTPLGEDALLLVGFSGEESISRLFNFHLDLIAENRTEIAFDKLLGQSVTVKLDLDRGRSRYFNGICSRVIKGHRDSTFTSYRLEVVPQFWFLTRRAQSRIFQHLSVPDILKKVLAGLDVAFQLQGTFHPRDFCVQYRETDFNFASRLMEEEGIFYFFRHSAQGGHTLVVADTSQSHPEMPEQGRVIFEEVTGGPRDEMRVDEWEKVQELRSAKYTLWDHNFELPHQHLEAEEPITPQVLVGKVAHKLNPGKNGSFMEIYDYPGGYAQRFDGVAKAGSEQAGELQKIFDDNKRTAKIRMQQEALLSLVIKGGGDCRNFVSGHKFTLERHFESNGDYLLVSVTHAARLSADYRSGDGEFYYQNNFTCIPFAVPFRPLMLTPKPVVHGTQTAVVVGPPGEEIFVDKYGRVKVQFHWDRAGQANADSSCWIRVAQNISGVRWGSAFWPRTGQEVLVDFREGDPDQPIVIGSVYNAAEMPPYKLPDEKTKTVLFKSNSSKGGGGFNEFRVEDKKGKEQIFIHAERNKDIRIKNDRYETVGHNSHFIVTHDQLEKVGGDKHLKVKGDQNEAVDGTVSLKAGQDLQEKVGQKYALDAGMEIHLKSGMNLVLETGASLTLKVGGNFININPGGVFISGTMVMINSGGSAGSGSGSSPEAPKKALEADRAKPGSKSAPLRKAPPKPTKFSPAALVMLQAARTGQPFCDI
jgi:type VI secretion system secreted protein VgrG